jgi:hypothetical protein
MIGGRQALLSRLLRASLFTNPEIDVFGRALLPIHEKIMQRPDTYSTRYAGLPVVRHGLVSACAFGLSSIIAKSEPNRLPA